MTDKQKIRLLKQVVRNLRSCLEDSGIDSSACLCGSWISETGAVIEPSKAENAWILKEYRARRL